MCKELFHPNWWVPWGFKKPDEQMMTLVTELSVHNLCNSLKQALKHECLVQRDFYKF